MNRPIYALAFAALSACGTAGPHGPMPGTVPISVIEERPVHPVKELMPVIGLGQSLVAQGREGSYGIGQQYARRLQIDNPQADVQYFQAAIGGQSVVEMHSGGKVAVMLQQVYDAGLPATDLIVNQGQADQNMDGGRWVNQWGFTLQEMRNKGFIDKDTNITFGEMAHGVPSAARNADLPELASRFGVNIASAEGIPTFDGVHPTKRGLNMFGNVYYDAAKKGKSN